MVGPLENNNTSLKILAVVLLIFVIGYLIFYPKPPEKVETTRFPTEQMDEDRSVPATDIVLPENATIGDNDEMVDVRIDPGSPPELNKIAALLFDYTNKERIRNNISILIYDEQLEEVAKWQSKCLSENKILEHDSIECLFLEERFVLFDITDAGGENLFLASDAEHYYLDSGDPVEYYSEEEIANIVYEGWMKSISHKENILEKDYTHMAIGVHLGDEHEIIVTQNFKVYSDCGWKDESCCPEDYNCYEPWSCQVGTLICK